MFSCTRNFFSWVAQVRGLWWLLDKLPLAGHCRLIRSALHPVQFSLLAQLCLTLCDPMGGSIPGFPVHHQLPKLAQTHVHQIGDAIRPSHPLCSLLLPSVFPSLRFFSNELALCIRWPKYWSSASASVPPGNIQDWLSSGLTWLDLAVQGAYMSCLIYEVPVGTLVNESLIQIREQLRLSF